MEASWLVERCTYRVENRSGCWSTADRFGPQSTQVRQHVFQSTASEPNTIAALGVSDRLYSMAPCLTSYSQLNAAVQPALYYERDPA